MKAIRIFVLLFLLSLGGTMLFLRMGAVPDDAERMRIDVESGESVRAIAGSLRGADLIGSSHVFRLYVRWKELDRSFKPGVYLIPMGASYEEIARILTGGEGEEMAVTIPEGFTIAQMDELLARIDLLEPGALSACAKTCDFSAFEFLPAGDDRMPHGRLEGYLFPDTYFVNAAEFDVQKFHERLLRTFEERVASGLQDDLAVSGRDLSDVITMASLIERETVTSEERPIVSGILWKRLDAGRALDVDATVRYILEKPTNALTRSDLEFDSPYNTRRIAGFPPGPIANPGLASIKAALHPEDSPYWYYLHDNEGKIHYAETNDEHNVNKVRYL
ncbi:MAG: endolytic transglycosylase MltG [Patescibacteria group bacterium]